MICYVKSQRYSIKAHTLFLDSHFVLQKESPVFGSLPCMFMLAFNLAAHVSKSIYVKCLIHCLMCSISFALNAVCVFNNNNNNHDNVYGAVIMT